MPEGDTIARAARALKSWLEGRTITAARCVFGGFPAQRLVGATVDAVEARGKHLLIRMSTGDIVHTHLRMTGSWHVYERDHPWRKPAHHMRLVLEAGDRVAVCFDAPTVELLRPGGDRQHPALVRLGPDVLAEEFDTDEVVRRARASPPATPVGDVLLDQRVVSGIGNIWRSESLFRARLHPATPVVDVPDDRLAAAVGSARELMRRSAHPGAGRPAPAVYRRAGRPCPRCGGRIDSARMGIDARTVYWCPRCQPE